MRFAVARIGFMLAVSGCVTASGGAPRVLDLQTQSDSGVAGTVTLTPMGDDQTVVEIDVDPAGHPDMPAHIHAGRCAEMVPQPMFPLESVRDGTSRTEIPISLAQLLADTVTLNLHHSNEQLKISVACVDLTPA